MSWNAWNAWDAQMLTTQLDLGRITVKEARAHARKVGLPATGRTREQLIRSWNKALKEKAHDHD